MEQRDCRSPIASGTQFQKVVFFNILQTWTGAIRDLKPMGPLGSRLQPTRLRSLVGAIRGGTVSADPNSSSHISVALLRYSATKLFSRNTHRTDKLGSGNQLRELSFSHMVFFPIQKGCVSS